ncbi:energy transducer TonB [Flavicella sp.]|uniref:energy transducer TonB n=1 Tax=Flavicella sp. TaxID=2957742 RepID=UPI003017CFCE
MELKKNPKADLQNYTNLFVQLGLVLALFIVYVSIEHKTYDRAIADLGIASLSGEEDEEMVITSRPIQVKPPPPPPPPAAPEIIEIVDDTEDIEETIIQSTETDEEEAVEVEEIIEVDEGEEIIEDVPFAIIEDVPVFPGCEKGTKAEKKACFSKKISRHINRKFNSGLAADLGLSAGRKRIIVMFKIDKNGDVVDIQARAPHPRLVKETERVVKTLPKMIPGKQRGRPVGVSYSLPIVFIVE